MEKDITIRISELMDLFDEGEVTTADQIDRPQSATDREMFQDFNKRNPFNKGGAAERQRRLQVAYDKYGKDSLNKAAKVLGFKNFESMQGMENANLRRKIFRELEEFGEVMTEEGSRKRSRQIRLTKEQGIQIKLLNELNTKKFFDPKAFAKKNDISLKTLKDEARKLRNNIYDKRMLVSGKKMRSTLKWIPDDLQAADKALNKMWKAKLITNDRGKIENLFYDAFGNPKSPTFNPKKHLAIRNKLTEYYKLKDAINAKYPNIKFELDHPLSKSTLNKIFNATADQLTFVNPLTKDLNNGFKDSLSLQYENAIQGNNINKKKAVEKIAKDLKLNIGKVSNDATNFKYGVKEFEKLDMKEELLKAVRTQSDLSSNLKTYVKNNPDLFKQAGVNPNITLTNIKKSEVKGVENILSKFNPNIKNVGQKLAAIGCPNKAMGGRVEFNLGGSAECITRGLDNLRTGNMSPAAIKNARALMKTSPRVLSSAARVIAGLGLGTEAVLGGFFAATDYATGANKDEIISNLTYGFGGKSLEEQAQERNPLYNQALNLENVYSKYLAGFDEQGLPITGKNPRGMRKVTTEQNVLEAMEPFMTLSTPPSLGFEKEFDMSGFEKALGTLQELENEKTERALQRGFYEPGIGGSQRIDEFAAAGGGIAGLSGGIDKGPQRTSMNPDSQGLSGLLKRGIKV